MREIVDRIKCAIERLRDMQRRLKRYDITLWVNNFINELKSIKKVQKEMLASKLTPVVETRLLRDYAKSTRRLILLDYDGTLRPFEPKPNEMRSSFRKQPRI